MKEVSRGLRHDEGRLLAVALVDNLLEGQSLNEYMERTLPLIGEPFGTSRVVLIDYREQTDHFDLLHFEGYPSDAVYALRRRFEEMEIRRALRIRDPFCSRHNPNLLVIPLYFSDILEAVLVLEGDAPIQTSEVQVEVARVAARFLGLLMSSTRLAVNREQLVDLHDLRRARQIQLSFLPKLTPRSDRYEVFGYNNSSALVGGDYFDFFRCQQSSLQCVLADACGHGMASALIMSNFRGLLQAEILQHQDLRHLFDALNDSVHFEEDFIQYLTGVFLELDVQQYELRYLNAGHYEPLVVGSDGSVRSLPGGGPPLGMFKGSKYPLGEARLKPGEVITLFTDGLIDIENAQGEYFGTEGVTRIVTENRDLPLNEMAREVIGAARDFAGGRAIEDDITLFFLRTH